MRGLFYAVSFGLLLGFAADRLGIDLIEEARARMPAKVERQLDRQVAHARSRFQSFANETKRRVPTTVRRTLPIARASKVIYLNGEGARLTPGQDASMNRSSMVPAGKAYVDIPAFTGSRARWNSIVKCVESKFAAYDVAVVDRRPVDGDYVMVVVGGTSRVLGTRTEHGHAIGLAPFNSSPIPNAVVLAFSGATKNAVTSTCETIAMEVAHAYGLDHAYHCSDLMTYLPRCGKRAFLDRDLACGEHEKRLCQNGEPTQNAHRHLLEVLGPRRRSS